MNAPLVNDGPFNGMPLIERLADWQDDEAAKAFVPKMLADVAEAAAEIERWRAEAYAIWTDFVTACEAIECDVAPITAAKDTPEYHFARGAHSAANRIRRSVVHPKYRRADGEPAGTNQLQGNKAEPPND